MRQKYHYSIIITFLIIASCAAFGRIAGNDFIISSDDRIYITANHYIQSGYSAESIRWAFTTTCLGNWHPLTLISHILDWKLFGANPSGHHLVNLLLHIGAVIFLFLFLHKTTHNIWSSAFAAAFFALHPLRVESVAYAAERKDVLSMFFGIASIYVYAFYSENSKFSQYLLCLMLFTLALMSKPMLVTLPFVLMLLDYWPLGRWQKAMDDTAGNRFKEVIKLIGEKIPFVGLTIAASILAFWAQKSIHAVISLNALPFLKRITNAMVSYAAYLGKTLWPVNLSLFYPYYSSLPSWKVLTAILVLAVMTLVVLYYIKKLPFLFTGWFWYLGTFIPVIGLVQLGELAMADRYTYLPSVGIAMMLAWGIPSLIKSDMVCRKILLPLGIVVNICLSVLTWQQCGYWKNDIVLWGHSLNVTKYNHLAALNLGVALNQKGKTSEAINVYTMAINHHPNISEFYYNRGNVYADRGQYQNAIEDYSRAISLDPKNAYAYINRGSVYNELGQYHKAIRDFDKIISFQSDAITYFNRGNSYSGLGQYQRAIENFNQAILLKPNFAVAYGNRGTAYFHQGRNELGCRDAKKACEWGHCRLLDFAESKGYCR